MKCVIQFDDHGRLVALGGVGLAKDFQRHAQAARPCSEVVRSGPVRVEKKRDILFHDVNDFLEDL